MYAALRALIPFPPNEKAPMHEYMRARIQGNNIYLKSESKRYETKKLLSSEEDRSVNPNAQ